MTNKCSEPPLDKWARELFEAMRDNSTEVQPERFRPILHACHATDCLTLSVPMMHRGEGFWRMEIMRLLGVLSAYDCTRIAFILQTFDSMPLKPGTSREEADAAAAKVVEKAAEQLEPSRSLTIMAGDRSGAGYMISAPFEMEARIGGSVRKYQQETAKTIDLLMTGGVFLEFLVAIKAPGLPRAT